MFEYGLSVATPTIESLLAALPSVSSAAPMHDAAIWMRPRTMQNAPVSRGQNSALQQRTRKRHKKKRKKKEEETDAENMNGKTVELD